MSEIETRPPRDRGEALQVVDALVRRVTVLHHVDRDALLEVLGPYLRAGWCLRDIVTAMDERPSGESWAAVGQPSWVAGEQADRVLSRLRGRLTLWHVAGVDGEVMPGAYTTAARVALERAAAVRLRSAARAADERDRQAGAGRAGAGLAAARRVLAGISPSRIRRVGDRHELDARRAGGVA